MEGIMRNQIDSATQRLSDVKLSRESIVDREQCDLNVSDGDDPWSEDESPWTSPEELDEASGLDGEWNRRHSQFRAMGYRDGFLVGKEDSAQEGLNIGFRESVCDGFNWGVVRGVTTQAGNLIPDAFPALACLRDGLKEKLAEKQQNLQHSYEAVHSLSKTDELELYSDDLTSKSLEKTCNVELTSGKSDFQNARHHSSSK